ncbi:MAG: DUF2752 domain-containing protein [Lutibacter sp.]
MKIKYAVFLIIGLALAIVYYYGNPSTSLFFPTCPLYGATGLFCPGCGSQRATHQLLNFNFLGVLHHNVLYLIGLLIIGYHLIISGLNHIFKKNIYNFIYHPKTPVIILIFIIAFWILRNIPYYPFYLLAPN